MSQPLPIIVTDKNGNAYIISGASSGAQVAAPTPVVLTDVNGNALNLGAGSLPSGTTGVTQATHDNSTKLSTTAYADELNPNRLGIMIPPCPPLSSTATTTPLSSNNAQMACRVTITERVLITKFWYNITTAGTGGNPLIDIGLYDSTGTTLLVHLGAVAGTLGAKQTAIAGGGSYQLEPGDYYIAYTSNDDTVAFDCGNIGRHANVLNAGATKYCGLSGTSSTGGALNSSVGTLSANQLNFPIVMLSAA